MIHKLGSLIGSKDCQTNSGDGYWHRCVPMPFSGGLLARVKGAWAVLTEKAVAVKWPEPGELEKALAQ